MRIAALALTASLLWATAAAADGPEVHHAWARATPPGISLSAVYLTIDNTTGGDDTLLSASSPLAKSAELHVTETHGEMIGMRRVETLPVAAGARIEFAPGGLHIMLLGLDAPLASGMNVPLTLVFEKAGPLEVVATVADATAAHPDQHAGHAH